MNAGSGFRGRVSIILWLIAALPATAAAQTVVNSEKIDSVAVTLYRDPNRNMGPPNPAWPSGYALVTETRTIRVPAGRAVIRFQGVSQGMLPETAIVSGLPKQVNEKNRDALLLSPAGLVDAWLKRRVTFRRTDPATGKRTTQEAVIEAGPDGGVVLTTPDGVEALRCSGLPESLSYPRVPDGLFAKPTLSVVTESTIAATVQVQLSYLAEGFDWSANYVARVADDGETLDLFAWLTVVNGGSQGFANAHTQAVAGGLNKEAAAQQPKSPDPELHLQCWPADITSSHAAWTVERPPLPAAPGYWVGNRYGEIIVKARRRGRGRQELAPELYPPPPPMVEMAPPPPPPAPAIVAEQEDLGDLKLYRIPERVTIAAQSSKQVAMIDRRKLPFERVYTGSIFAYGNGSRPTAIVLRTENRDTKGLGLPLPAGGLAVFQNAGANSLLVAESKLADRAIGDDVELGAGESSDVRYEIMALPPTATRAMFRVRVTNAHANDEIFELTVGDNLVDVSATLGERKGRKIWRVTVPANGEAKLDYAFKIGPD